VLPAHFLVLNGPLRGLAVAACLQESLERSTDLLARTDGELLRIAAARPGFRAELAAFTRRALELRAAGWFPDLLGRGYLLLVEPEGRLRLVDFGLFDLRSRGRPTGRGAGRHGGDWSCGCAARGGAGA
jgi:hypothetical protein